jgi:branched-chain amino acid transport system ATP-binding protein
LSVFRAENIEVSYDGIRALRGVSLDIHDGETVALIGPNGAGKSSLINTISGLVKPQAGKIEFHGRDLTGCASWDVTKAGILQVPEGRLIFSGMSVLENLRVGETALNGRAPTHSLSDVYALFPILSERREQLAGSLSGGQQQMLAIGRALMGGPELLLLDEPSLGLAPVIISQVFAALAQLKKQGMTILLVEQNVNLALAASDRAFVIEEGTIIKTGASAALKDDPEITASYLGQG